MFPGRIGEHVTAGLRNLLAALVGLIERQAHQQADDQQQAEPGKEGDLALDRQEFLVHWKYLFPRGQ
ncbi:hypothetical protein D3C72_2113560 [compost metagenome]